MSQGSLSMAKGTGPAPRARAPMARPAPHGHKPCHEPWAMRYEPLIINLWMIISRVMPLINWEMLVISRIKPKNFQKARLGCQDHGGFGLWDDGLPWLSRSQFRVSPIFRKPDCQAILKTRPYIARCGRICLYYNHLWGYTAILLPYMVIYRFNVAILWSCMAVYCYIVIIYTNIWQYYCHIIAIYGYTWPYMAILKHIMCIYRLRFFVAVEAVWPDLHSTQCERWIETTYVLV